MYHIDNGMAESAACSALVPLLIQSNICAANMIKYGLEAETFMTLPPSGICLLYA